MAGLRVKVEGGNQLARRLAILPQDVSGEHLRQAALSGAGVIRKAASDNVKRGPGKTRIKGKVVGHLADHIIAEVEPVKSPLKVGVKVGPDKEHFYGPMLENGHALVRNGKVVGNVEPHPFMRPAMDEHLEEAQGVVTAEIRRRLGL